MVPPQGVLTDKRSDFYFKEVMTNEVSQDDPHIEELVLDRIGLAVSLREQGIDVDFNDWDGLSDESVSRIASVLVDLAYRNRGETDEI
jgi:hypothetical protein